MTFVDNGDGTATLSGTPATGTAGSYPLVITANILETLANDGAWISDSGHELGATTWREVDAVG